MLSFASPEESLEQRDAVKYTGAYFELELPREHSNS